MELRGSATHWEPREDVPDLLEEYLEKVDRAKEVTKRRRKEKTPQKQVKSLPSNGAIVRRSRQNRNGNPSVTSHATTKTWKPPSGSWEEEIDSIDACSYGENNEIIVYLTWRNGQKTRHDTSVAYKKCPQKMLKYYHSFIKITVADSNGVTCVENPRDLNVRE
ncbi:hypothetical protein HIM_11025 [Hirsutella minnesotensis 3608]|uniref:Chromo shadow domain-containing protein n=1 Tax=Hirsutella minnesotensis 3608 TaxID=1043627 RepID=A0A0F7ZRG8_9HYPO|nr:hypothetical protein HIM_11025 [Hirsutella minnesotensis 3608]